MPQYLPYSSGMHTPTPNCLHWESQLYLIIPPHGSITEEFRQSQYYILPYEAIHQDENTNPATTSIRLVTDKDLTYHGYSYTHHTPILNKRYSNTHSVGLWGGGPGAQGGGLGLQKGGLLRIGDPLGPKDYPYRGWTVLCNTPITRPVPYIITQSIMYFTL
ncbi:hypothetical protein G9A89_001262 [Geosiphon pyriformis]|nr:hypothetical protein G9A89_001262 [Geosiphon pyriformis]